MEKNVITADEQLTLLESRGLTVRDRDKAREILLDIGFYRLGFYLFPFEKSYPILRSRTHEYVEGATFEDAVRLYYFDFDLRMLLMRYLNRIEIAFRTALIYHLSAKYDHTPVWFVDPAVVNPSYARDFEDVVYTSDFKRNPVIRRHHKKHPDDHFAPAWKTIEFMSFGAVFKLYQELKEPEDKIAIAHKFGIRQIITFESYMHTIRLIRNACAHGQYIFDIKWPQGIRRGPATDNPQERYNLIGALRVIKYIMSYVSVNRARDMSQQIKNLYNELCEGTPSLKQIISDFSNI